MTMRALKAICLSAMMMLGASATTAQSTASQDELGDPEDILGSWSFATKPYRDGNCLMTGSMVLMPDPEPGVYACELTAIEVCTMWGKSVVVQDCTARRFGNQVSVRAVIREMLEYKPDADGLTYVPDNFALTVQSSNRMYGTLLSAATAPAEFIRNLDGIS